MTVKTLLNADMTTIGRALHAGWSWWLDELKELAPSRLRSGSRDGRAGYVFDGVSLQAIGGWVKHPPRNWTLLLPASAALVRRISVPTMRSSELTQLLRLENDRYFPLPPGAALVTHGLPEREGGGRMAVEAAALRLDFGRQVSAALAAENVRPAAIRLGGEGEAVDPRFDFAPAFRSAGLLAERSSAARNWWLAVAILFLTNLAMIAWRDIADVRRLEDLVEQQRPAVAIAQRLTNRMRQSGRLVERAAERRANGGAVGLLSQVTAAVPNEAWVQRYDWDGQTLRLAGYRQSELNLPVALRSAPFASSIRNAQADTLAEVAAGQPFDVTIRLKGR